MKKIILILLAGVLSLFAYEELSIDNFDSKIKGKNVIIDFYASWCPPCKILAKNLEDFEVIKPDNIEIYKVNVEEELVLAKKYGISKLPTMLYFKNGKLVDESVGILSKEEILSFSQKVFK